jgi:proteasome lid subunit RPN8/RPN11
VLLLLSGMEEEHHSFEEYDVEPPKWRKPLIIVIGIFLIILTISYVLPSSRIYHISIGKIVSEQLDPSFSAPLANGKEVIFEEGAYNQLRTLFFAEQENEFAVCLTGEVQDGNYLIDDLYVPTIFDQSHTHVSSQRCNEESIISLHTHPLLSCLFSDTDINYYRSISKDNKEMIIALMCDVDRFNFYFE